MNTSKYEQTVFSNDILLSVEHVTPTSLTLNIENQSNEDFVYDADYELEYFQHTWHTFDVGPIAVILMAKMLPAHSLVEEPLDWSHTYGVLASGQYRLIKRIGPHIASVSFTVASSFS